MCYITSSIGKSGRRHVVNVEGMTVRQAKEVLRNRRFDNQLNEIRTFEGWLRNLRKFGHFFVEESKANAFARFCETSGQRVCGGAVEHGMKLIYID